MILDIKNKNNGTLSASNWDYCSSLGAGCITPNHALTFGSVPVSGVCCNYSHSGEGIASARTSGSPNRFGLDFYTCYTKRISITQAGNVGIGTSTPSSALQVNGAVSLSGVVGIGTSTPSSLLEVAGTTTIDSTLTLKGCAPNIIAATPTSTLAVLGSMSATGSLCVNGIISLKGIVGNCPTGEGVFGFSPSGAGVCGTSCGTGGIGVRGTACGPESIPIVAKGCASQIANLQQWQRGCTVKSVVNKCGWLGINTCKPQTTLQVKGGISLNVKCAGSSCLTMKTSCFAVFAPTVGKTITLPAAKNGGMVVYIKNTSSGAVTIKPASGDHITEGTSAKTSYSLASGDAISLIANGNKPGNWFFLSLSTM
jgi:hypothetical protein